MGEETFRVSVPGHDTVTAVRTAPEGRSDPGVVFVYAPGAGSNVHDPFGVHACRRLASLAYTAVRFQFPYMEARRRRPDRTPVLEATWRAVMEEVRDFAPRLVAGGRSMGGRVASQVVAGGTDVAGLALFAYPLNPPQNPAIRRDEHLPLIGVPTFFCSGTRDTFATPDDLRLAASKVPGAAVHLLDGADHGFGVLKSSRRTREDVRDEAVDALLEWLASEAIGTVDQA